ncbi:MAG TPA: type II CAAX endopeptidase family protein [Thermomonas sp.]|nr:type II CAAX endopeptidase family protein [Thermomonas sp.]
MADQTLEPNSSTSPMHGQRDWPRMRLAARTLFALLLGGAAVLGSIFAFRQGLLPLIDAWLQPDAGTLSAIRRIGILLAAVAGYGTYVRWHEKRRVTELRPPLLALPLGAAGGALMVGLPMALLFAIDAYEPLLFRGASSALWGVAALIVIAAILEELVYRGLLFRVLERSTGTGIALVVQALVFAVGHLENLPDADIGDAARLLVSVSLLGVLWAALFVLTRNLWVVAAHHAAWNFTILLAGLPLSGIEDWRALAPMESRMLADDWLTGGMFGPEGSLLVIATTTLATLWVLRVAKRRGTFVSRVR